MKLLGCHCGWVVCGITLVWIVVMQNNGLVYMEVGYVEMRQLRQRSRNLMCVGCVAIHHKQKTGMIRFVPSDY